MTRKHRISEVLVGLVIIFVFVGLTPIGLLMCYLTTVENPNKALPQLGQIVEVVTKC